MRAYAKWPAFAPLTLHFQLKRLWTKQKYGDRSGALT